MVLINGIVNLIKSMSRIFSRGKICFGIQTTKYQCGNVRHRRYEWHASEEIEKFNHVIDRSVLLYISPKSGIKGQSFLKLSYSCDASIFVLIAFDV